jgi:hypothetical protein
MSRTQEHTYLGQPGTPDSQRMSKVLFANGEITWD